MSLMDDQNYRDLVRKAWELSNAIDGMQKTLMKMFLDEFVDLDVQYLEKQSRKNTELPF